MFSRAGFELYVIQLIGRWGSDAIKRYVQDTPLLFQCHFAQRTADKLQNTITEIPEHETTQERASGPAPMETHVPLAIQDMDAIRPAEQELRDLRDKLETLQIAIDSVQGKEHLVVNAKTKCCHLIRSMDGTSDSWRTHCGDSFANWTYELHRLLPSTSWPCSGCHQLRRRKKTTDKRHKDVTATDSDHSNDDHSSPHSSSESE